MSDPGAKPAQSVLPLVEGQVVSGTLFSEPMREFGFLDAMVVMEVGIE